MTGRGGATPSSASYKTPKLQCNRPERLSSVDKFKSKQGGLCLLKTNDLIICSLFQKMRTCSSSSPVQNQAEQRLKSHHPISAVSTLTTRLLSHLLKAPSPKELQQKPAASHLSSEGEEKNPQKVLATQLHMICSGMQNFTGDNAPCQILNHTEKAASHTYKRHTIKSYKTHTSLFYSDTQFVLASFR